MSDESGEDVTRGEASPAIYAPQVDDVATLIAAHLHRAFKGDTNVDCDALARQIAEAMTDPAALAAHRHTRGAFEAALQGAIDFGALMIEDAVAEVNALMAERDILLRRLKEERDRADVEIKAERAMAERRIRAATERAGDSEPARHSGREQPC